MRIQTKYQLIGAIGSAAIICLAMFIDGWFTFRENEERIRQNHQQETRLIFGRVKGAFDEIEKRLTQPERLPWGFAELSAELRESEYNRLLSSIPAIRSITRYDSEGNVDWTLDQVNEGRASDAVPKKLPDWIEANGADVQTRVVGQTLDAFPRLFRAIRHEDLADWIVYRIDLRFLSDTASIDRIGRSGLAYLVDSGGVPVSSTVALSVPRVDTSLLRTPHTARVGREDVLRSVYALGSGLFLVGDVPLSEANLSLHSVVARIAVILLASLMASAFFVALSARAISRPIVTLRKEVDDYAAGNLSTRSLVKTKDEIGSLAQSFNEMAAEIESYAKGLEAKVQEKTAQLETEFTRRESQAKEIAKLEERSRIVRDFHDSVGGHLVGLLSASKRDALDTKALERLVSDALVDFRIAIDSLTADETDLATALANLRFRLTPRLQAAGLQSRWDVDEFAQTSKISRESIFHIQRVVTEALTNTIKHANAKSIDVRLVRVGGGNRLQLQICDDGVGMPAQRDLESIDLPGRGLKNIQQRAALIKGDVQWGAGVDGRGTMLRLTFPVC